MEAYLKVLPWVGRAVSALALFVPYGLYLAAMGLILTETLVLIWRLVRTLERVLEEE
jgi:hypothetical protein